LKLLNAASDLDYALKVIPDAGGWNETSDGEDILVEEGDDAAAGAAAAAAAAAAEAADDGSGEDSGGEVDEAEDDMEPEESDDEDGANTAAHVLGPVADRLERLGEAAVLRIEPRNAAPPGSAEEADSRAQRCRRPPARFRDRFACAVLCKASEQHTLDARPHVSSCAATSCDRAPYAAAIFSASAQNAVLYTYFSG
jgi:hypothetical protein